MLVRWSQSVNVYRFGDYVRFDYFLSKRIV